MKGMLHISQQTPSRLALEDRQPGAAVVAALFTALAVLSFLATAYQGAGALTGPGQQFDAMRGTALSVFLLVEAAFVGLGVMAVAHFGLGVRCTLDKDEGTVVIRTAGALRPRHETYSIYAVSHFEVQANESAHAWALFLVLRSGERIPVSAFPAIDREVVDGIVRDLRGFLRA